MIVYDLLFRERSFFRWQDWKNFQSKCVLLRFEEGRMCLFLGLFCLIQLRAGLIQSLLRLADKTA